MNYYLLVFGVLFSLFVVYDFCYTTLSANGIGVLTGRVSQTIRKAFLLICHHKGAHPFFNHAGMVTIVVNLFTWVIFTWAAGTLIFLSDPASIVNVATLTPASTLEKIYFTGNTLSTLGMGDFKPNGHAWQIFTVILSLSGLTILTIAITYLVQVLAAEISKRQLSLYIATLGGTPQSILLNGWNGHNFDKLEKDLAGLSHMILTQSRNQLAFPIVHHFHVSQIRESSAINLTALDEALTILRICVPPSAMGAVDIGSVRKALTTYLLTLQTDFIEPSTNNLPLPDLAPLREAGIPVMADETMMKDKYSQLFTRRKLLRALLENDGWQWEDLNHPKFHSELDLY